MIARKLIDGRKKSTNLYNGSTEVITTPYLTKTTMDKKQIEKILDKWFDDFMVDKLVRTDVHSTVAFCTLKEIVFNTVIPEVLKSVIAKKTTGCEEVHGFIDIFNEHLKVKAESLFDITL